MRIIGGTEAASETMSIGYMHLQSVARQILSQTLQLFLAEGHPEPLSAHCIFPARRSPARLAQHANCLSVRLDSRYPISPPLTSRTSTDRNFLTVSCWISSTLGRRCRLMNPRFNRRGWHDPPTTSEPSCTARRMQREVQYCRLRTMFE